MSVKPDYTDFTCAVICTSVVCDGNPDLISPDTFSALGKRFTQDFSDLPEHPKVQLGEFWGSAEIKAQVTKKLMCRYAYTDKFAPDRVAFVFLITLSKDSQSVQVQLDDGSHQASTSKELFDILLAGLLAYYLKHRELD